MRRLRPSSVSTGSIEMQFALHRAVAAALADELVDHDAPVGVREARRACAGGAPRRRRSGRRRARRRPATSRSSLLHAVELVAVVERDAGREARRRRYLFGSSLTTAMRAHALGVELARDLGHRDLARHRLALDRLAARHRDGAVDEDLVGDVDVRGDGGADREQPGVEVGAVAHVLEDVRRLGEGRLRRSSWRPRRPSASRRACAARAARPPCRDSRSRRARRCPRARTVERLCGQPEQKLGRRMSAPTRPRRRSAAGAAASVAASSGARRSSQPRSDLGDRAGVELALGRHERRAALVALAEQARPVARVVEQRARAAPRSAARFSSTTSTSSRPVGEAARALGLERPDHRRPCRAQSPSSARARSSMPSSSSAWRTSR